ncbi:Vacuolar protein-sorting-associated protein 25 [Saguinus oedipus]|uniref:Vacuolar protein-sorting-associated protein 25 n=1 Tax=Saguinus oedipus TaxID=9490 RepID=A0ABQ9VTM3_SAGOE|nr:Vacuolar protein-sorting-associated protein 25 [Saguinus oedipus]
MTGGGRKGIPQRVESWRHLEWLDESGKIRLFGITARDDENSSCRSSSCPRDIRNLSALLSAPPYGSEGRKSLAGSFRVSWATTMAMSFEWPWQYRFPPFFTLQPNVDTRQKQLAAWCSLVLSFCRLHKQSSMTVMEAQESPLFNNVKLQRNLEWLDKSKSSFLIMWRRPEEWGKLIYQWVSRSGQNNSVFTLYELTNGEDTEDEEFHGLDEATLLRALQALQQEHKAEIITVSDGRGVKFF